MALNTDKKPDSSKKPNETLQGLIGLAVLVVLAVIFVPMFFGGSKENAEDTAKKEEQSQQERKALADRATKELDKLGDNVKSTIASEPDSGRQGDIVKVEPYSDDAVKVIVSTYFENPSEEGKQIAKNIYVNLCTVIPELDSLYVHSNSSGMDSSSIYRKDVPICNR